jgi:hypothetical protein
MPTIPSALRSVSNQDGAVILDIPHDRMVTLNPTGAYVWERLRQGKTVEEAIRDLAAETSADLSTVAHDVQAFLKELRSSQLLND